MKLRNNKTLTRSGWVVACLILVSFSIVFTSCKDKDDDDVTTPVTTEKGTLFLHLHNYIDDMDMGEVPGFSVTDNNGREIKINKANFYISEIQVVKLDGTVHSFAGKKFLKTFGTVLYDVGELPTGNYNTVRFKIGLDAATNALDPWQSADSAILNKPDMWFGGNAQPDGYVFMNLQGTIDTSSNHTEPAVSFNYKIGTNANYKQVTVSGINSTIVKDQATTAHMVIDYNALFNGIQVNSNSTLSIITPAENSTTPASTIANQMVQMFKLE